MRITVYGTVDIAMYDVSDADVFPERNDRDSPVCPAESQAASELSSYERKDTTGLYETDLPWHDGHCRIMVHMLLVDSESDG
jgi:hypothetical protein